MTWWQRLRRGHRADEDLDRELRYHVDRLKDDEARAGASEAAAARKATLTFGGLDQVKEECRDVRTFVWLDRLKQDTRYALRTFARHPGFTIVVLLIFALGIRAVSVSAGLPLSTVTDVGIRFDGRVGADAGTTANYYGVTADYFRSMQIPLIRGRVFAESDTASAPPVVVINETMAVRFFPNEDPIGKRLDISGPTFMREIVGVVGDVRQEGLRSQPPPQVYEPFLQKPSRSFNVVVRSLDDPKRVTDAVRQAVLTIDRGQPVSAVKTMNDAVSLSIARDRFALILLSAFAILALLLATAGVGGVVAYSVGQRTSEIGVRMALGASRARILRMVLNQSMWTVSLGVGIGLLASTVLTRFLASMLFQVDPRDPWTFVGGSALLVLVALAAAAIPARRASRIDPLIALRAE